MDYQSILLVVLACALIYGFVVYVVPFLKELKFDFDYKKAVTLLWELALVFGDDEMDEICDKVYNIFLDIAEYAEETSVDGSIDFDELLKLAVEQVENAGIEIGEVEQEVLNMACEIISSLIYKIYK